MLPLQLRLASPVLCYRALFSRTVFKTEIKQHRKMRLNAIFCTQLSEVFLKNSQKTLKSMQLFSVPTADPIRSLKTDLKVLYCLQKFIAMVEQRWAVSAPALPLVYKLLKDKKNYNNKHEQACCSCACQLQTLVWLIPIGNSSWAWW